MPMIVDSRGINVFIDDAEAERDALVALRECDRQLDTFEASGRRDQAAARMAVSLYGYAAQLLGQIGADADP